MEEGKGMVKERKRIRRGQEGREWSRRKGMKEEMEYLVL